MTREELLSRLSKLPPSQFEQVLYLARIPREHLPGAAAAQALRAVEFMRYVEQQNQIDQLAGLVEQVVSGIGGQTGDDVSQNPTAAQPVTSEGGPASFRLRRAEQVARAAAAAVLAHLKNIYRFDGHYLLHLDLQEYLDREQRAHANTVPSLSTLEELADDLSNARSIILIAPPGAGKTITLLQLAEKLLARETSPIPIMLPVASWVSSGEGLFQYLTARLTALGVESPDVELLLNSSKLTLLLNGWNEGAEGEQARANDRIREFALSYPNIALAITTRATRTTPALSCARVLTLRQLTLIQKTIIIRNSSLSDPEGFLKELENNVALSKITNTPLFFAVALQLARSNRPIPQTRAELLESFTKELITIDNHSDMLEIGPCRGLHNWYLEAAARSMTNQARTILTTDELNIALANCSRMLQHDGYLSAPASTTEIADNLVRHHTLVQLEAAGGYAFVHQQFQEWFAARWLKRHVSALSGQAAAADILKFQCDVLDQTLWRPALEFTIELLLSTKGYSVIADIVRWMIPVDLIVAAELSYIGGQHVWSNVRAELGAMLRDWYKRDSREHQRCALAAMLATGAADFADLIWPELGDDDQSFYELLRLCGQNFSFRTNSLGVGWQARVVNWSESQQEAFFLNVYAGPDEIDFAEARAISGPPSVRIAALALLMHQSEFERIGRVISATEISRWPPEFYQRTLSQFPSELIVMLTDKLHDALTEITDLTLRRGLICALQHTASKAWIGIAKQDLDKALTAWRESRAPSTFEERLSPHWAIPLIYSYVELLKPIESEWVANWLVDNIGRDLLWERPFIQYLRYLPAPLLVPLVHAVVPSSFRTSHMEFIRTLPSNVPTRSQTAEQLQALLANDSMSVRCAVLDVYLEGSKPQTEQMRLRTALRDLPIGQLVDAIAVKAKMLSEFGRLRELAELVSPGSLTDLHLFEGLSNSQRETLRCFIHRVVSALPEKEEGLTLRPPLAVILGALGYVDDVVIVAGWVAAEQERWEAHHHALARAKTFQERRLLGEYGLNWWPWYRSALARFKCLAAEQVLLAWLNSGYLIGEGAQGLVELSIADHSLQALSGDLRGRFCALPPVRPRPSDPRAQARANAIIAALERFDHSELSDFAQREALTMTAAALADFNDARAVDRLLKLDATRTGWSLVKSSIAMCRRGTILPGRRLATALEPFLAKHEGPRNGTNNDSWWVVMDALSVLLASDEPTVAIERMRRIPDLQAQSDRVHDLCNLLSTSLLPEAGAYLVELIGSVDYTDPSALRAIEALASSNHPACHAGILGLVTQHTSTWALLQV